MNSDKTILSLCDFSGNWPSFYKAAGYNVISLDIKNGGNVRLLEVARMFPKGVHGILCAPPCTVFAASGARWKRTDADMENGLAVVDACLRAVMVLKPKFWALENPVGKLSRYLGAPALWFDPCDYGDPYTKKTGIWGSFNLPAKNPVEPTEGSKMWALYGGKSEKTKTMRSMTPLGFAKAFFEANP